MTILFCIATCFCIVNSRMHFDTASLATRPCKRSTARTSASAALRRLPTPSTRPRKRPRSAPSLRPPRPPSARPRRPRPRPSPRLPRPRRQPRRPRPRTTRPICTVRRWRARPTTGTRTRRCKCTRVCLCVCLSARPLILVTCLPYPCFHLARAIVLCITCAQLCLSLSAFLPFPFNFINQSIFSFSDHHYRRRHHRMFEIRGKLGKGYVAAELVLDGGKPKYNSLTVTHAKDMQRLLLEGDAAPPLKVCVSAGQLCLRTLVWF
jgi:hypothetical protein